MGPVSVAVKFIDLNKNIQGLHEKTLALSRKIRAEETTSTVSSNLRSRLRKAEFNSNAYATWMQRQCHRSILRCAIMTPGVTAVQEELEKLVSTERSLRENTTARMEHILRGLEELEKARIAEEELYDLGCEPITHGD